MRKHSIIHDIIDSVHAPSISAQRGLKDHEMEVLYLSGLWHFTWFHITRDWEVDRTLSCFKLHFTAHQFSEMELPKPEGLRRKAEKKVRGSQPCNYTDILLTCGAGEAWQENGSKSDMDPVSSIYLGLHFALCCKMCFISWWYLTILLVFGQITICFYEWGVVR